MLERERDAVAAARSGEPAPAQRRRPGEPGHVSGHAVQRRPSRRGMVMMRSGCRERPPGCRTTVG